MEGERVALSRVAAPVERLFYRLSGVEPAREQSWFVYTLSMLASASRLPLALRVAATAACAAAESQGFDGVAPDLAFNTSLSFNHQHNWQNYGGETR